MVSNMPNLDFTNYNGKWVSVSEPQHGLIEYGRTEASSDREKRKVKFGDSGT